VEGDVPERLHAEHVAVPRDDRLHGQAVRRDVIDLLDAEHVRRVDGVPRPLSTKPGAKRL
jgi:hypothetical protein